MTLASDDRAPPQRPRSTPDRDTPPAFLNMRQLRAHFGIGEMTFRRMIEQGRFPRPVRLTQQRVAWRAADVAAWAASRVEVD